MALPSLSAAEARRAALRAQGFLGADGRRGGVPGMLRRLGSVQLDTISVLARSHELVPYARLGAIPKARVEKAYWSSSPPARCFEYWSHAACILPAEEWPLFAFRRRWYRARGQRWHKVERRVCDAVLERIRDEGPLTVTDLGGSRAGGEWWDWNDTKIAVEWLLDTGEVVCAERRAWKRVYDLPERALGPEITGQELDDHACVTRLVEQAGAAMGVATEADLADYHRLKQDQVRAVLSDTALEAVEVEGWKQRAWAHPEALAQLGVRGRHRTTLLSPFDSLVWDRPRTLRLFGFKHLLEAYVPAPKRVHGYFAMPLLTGGRLRGRVDPGREGTTLVAKRLSLSDPSQAAVEGMAQALKEAASWVGCDAVRLDAVDPPELRAEIEAALA